MIVVFKWFGVLSLRSFLYNLAQKPSKGHHKSKSGQSNGIKERKLYLTKYSRKTADFASLLQQPKSITLQFFCKIPFLLNHRFFLLLTSALAYESYTF
jgi:hypothetical protein